VLNRWKTKQHATQQNKTKENTKLFPDFVGSLFKPLFITLLFLYSPHLKRTRGKPEPPAPGGKTKGRTKRNQHFNPKRNKIFPSSNTNKTAAATTKLRAKYLTYKVGFGNHAT